MAPFAKTIPLSPKSVQVPSDPETPRPMIESSIVRFCVSIVVVVPLISRSPAIVTFPELEI